MKSNDLVLEIAKMGIITEKEINLIKIRLNRGEKVDLNPLNEKVIKLTDEQNKKGIDFLINLYKTPRGIERKNNPFGFYEQRILDNFSHFCFNGYYNVGKYDKYYIPVYSCYSDVECFVYYYMAGKINIIN